MKPRTLAVLSGGVGGSRLVQGLCQVLSDTEITVVVNTGDDFVHWGLHVSPDIDTVLYTLSGIGDGERGWGLAYETFNAMAMMSRYGGEAWFRLGDGDLATHVMRTEALRRGATLTEVTRRQAQGLDVQAHVVPMTDDRLQTFLDTMEGELSLQDYLVRYGARPVVKRIFFCGDATATPEVCAALAQASAVVIAPSNPYVSIDPILHVRGVRSLLGEKPVVAVSPIVAGRAIKGPLATMIEALEGCAPSAAAIASHYGSLLDGMVVERGDGAAIGGTLRTLETTTVMGTPSSRRQLARDVLTLVDDIVGTGHLVEG